jgi:hypothetical protein
MTTTSGVRVYDARGIETAEIYPRDTFWRVLQLGCSNEVEAVAAEIERFAAGFTAAPVLLVSGPRDAAKRLVEPFFREIVVEGPATVVFSGIAAVCAHMDRMDLTILSSAEFTSAVDGLWSPVVVGWPTMPRLAIDPAQARAQTPSAQHALSTLSVAATLLGVLQTLHVHEGELALVIRERCILHESRCAIRRRPVQSDHASFGARSISGTDISPRGDCAG